MELPKVAVIGCGYWGKNLVRNFHEIGVLATICDPVETTAKEISRQYGVTSKSWAQILSDTSVRGVVIASPAISHAKLSIEAIKAGKDVYVEKPLALSIKEAEEVKAILVESKQLLMVGHLLQYHPAVEKIRYLIGNDILGKLLYIRAHRFNFGKIRQDENALWSFAPHDFSVIYSLINEYPTSIASNAQKCFNDNIEDIINVHMIFPSEIAVDVCVSWLHPFKEQKLVVVGSKSMVVFDDTLPINQKLKIYRHEYNRNGKTIKQIKNEPECIPLENVEPLKAECCHFVDCIKTRQQPKTDINEGIQVLRLLQESQASV